MHDRANGFGDFYRNKSHSGARRCAHQNQLHLEKNKSNLTCRSRALSAKIILPTTANPLRRLQQADQVKLETNPGEQGPYRWLIKINPLRGN